LADALGGTSVAGGKMKMTGTDYWSTPNTGATNESGFTALGGGFRNTDGSFSLINAGGFAYTTTVDGANVFRIYVQSGTSELLNTSVSKLRGIPIRLIKE
jgi:hypothetical protein